MDKNNLLNTSIIYSSSGLTLGTDSSSNSLNYSNFNDYCQNWYPYCYSYPTYIHDRPNPMETAFKLVSKLLEKKIIQKITLKQFIELVGEVSKLI